MLRRVLHDQPAAAGAFARVHVHPKRFPAAYAADWRARVVHAGLDCVVIDKPAGVQVSPTVDNVLESAAACAAAALGLPAGSLHGLHRLDAGTSGIVVLGKGGAAGFAQWFAAQLQDKGAGAGGGGGGEESSGGGEAGAAPADAQAAAPEAAEAAAAAPAAPAPGAAVKVYRAATLRPPPLGRIVHWAAVNSRAPGEPAHTLVRPAPFPGGLYCELEVLRTARVRLTRTAMLDYGPGAYESEIRLVTGRTHQIRAQLAALGCPLLGDLLYEAVEARRRESEGREQQQEGLEGQQGAAAAAAAPGAAESAAGGGGGSPGAGAGSGSSSNGPFKVGAAAADWSRAAQADPLRPIGLQAYRLRLHDPGGRMGVAAVAAAAPEAGGGGDSGNDADGEGGGDGDERRPGARAAGGGYVEFVAGAPWWRE